MTHSRRVKWLALLTALALGTATQVGVNGCYDFYVSAAVSAFDFCSVFNCQGGTFFDFCDPNAPLFVDCPTTP